VNPGRVVVLGLALAFLLAGSSAVVAQANRGFVTYQVTVSSPKGMHSALINETVGPSDKTGYSDLVLQFIGTEQNFSYSRFVNASGDLFPYLPFVGNQSIRYDNGTRYRVQVNITTAGTTSITFKGSQYDLSVVKITASASYENMSFRGNGTVEAFPSTLIYSATVGNSTYRLQSVLQATDLPLNASSSPMSTDAVVGAGVGVGAVAVVGVFLFRRREHKSSTQGEKPLHWAD